MSKASPDEQETGVGREKGIPTAVTILGKCVPARAIPGSLQWQRLVIAVLQHTKGWRGNKGGQGHAQGQSRKPAEETALGFAVLPRPSAHPAVNPP